MSAEHGPDGPAGAPADRGGLPRALGARRSPQLAGRRWIVAVPLGSLEQHGPHLPLDTDTRIAAAVAHAAAETLDDVVVAPALPFGASGEHAGFAGTLSIGTAALEHVLVELARSAGPEVSAICLVNGHGGNVDAVRAATRVAAAEGRRMVAWFPPRVPGGDAHAGRTETSLLLAIDRRAVDLARAERGAVAPLADLLPRLRAEGVRGVSANGVLGDPAGASVEEGRALLQQWADHLRTTLLQLRAQD